MEKLNKKQPKKKINQQIETENNITIRRHAKNIETE